MDIQEESEAEILKDLENLVENIGGSKFPEEEGTNFAVSIAERVNFLKRGRPKNNYDESNKQDSEKSDDLCMEDGETDGKKKSLGKTGVIIKEESDDIVIGNAVGEEKKNAGRKAKEVGFEEGLVEREEDVEMGGDNGGDVRERDNLKDLVEENSGPVLAVEEQREKLGCNKEDEGSSGYELKEQGVSSSVETEKAEPRQRKGQKEEYIGGKKEEGEDSNKDNSKIGWLENEEGGVSRTRKRSRKAMEMIEKLNMEMQDTEDENEGFSRNEKRRRGRERNRVPARTAQQEDEKTNQRKRRSHNKAMQETRRKGLKVNGKPSKRKREPGKRRRDQEKNRQQEDEKTRKRGSHNKAMQLTERKGLKVNGEPSKGKRKPGNGTKPRVGLKKDENVSTI